jgi:tellurite methyltransferase
MSEADLRKWDDRYRAGSYAGRTHASALLARFIASVPRGRALDIACGTGRNALYLAEHGFEVDAVDISEVGLERARANAAARGVEVNWIAADLDDGLPVRKLGDERYQLIALVRYVKLALVRPLISRLADNGVLVAEEHLATSAPVVGPKSAAYRVGPNVLLEAAGGLRILYYREGVVEDPDGRRAALAQLVGCRGRAPFDADS